MGYLDLTGQTALVTGAAQGIGLAIATRLAAAGARVALADRNVAGAQTQAATLGNGAIGLAVDVADSASVNQMVDECLAAFGRITILVNNAGIVGHAAAIEHQTDQDWHQMIAIDLTGVFYCCRAVIPHLRAQGRGRIINIASIAGKEGNPNMVPYSAAKAGVIGLTKALAKEVAREGIAVNAIAPALIQTAMADQVGPDQLRYLVERIPMGRLGRVEEVAALVHWLASAEVTFSTGAVYDLSGGRATY